MRLIFFLLLISSFAYSESCSQTANALSSCNKYVHALEDQSALQLKEIATLKDVNTQLEIQLDKTSSNPILPSWAWFLIGAGAGVTGTLLLKH